MINFNDVINIEKKAVFGFIPNAIEIICKNNKSYYFCSFSKRNAAFKLMYCLWKEEPFTQEECDQFDEDANDNNDLPTQSEVPLNEETTKINEINFLQTDPSDKQKELLKVVLPLTVDRFFELFFADDAVFSLAEHYKLKNERDINLSKWIENPEMGIHTRELKMVINVKENPLRDHSRCYKVQSYKKEEGKLTINSMTKNLDIPYGSCFQVEEKWEITPYENDKEKCMLRCVMWTVFNKSTLFKNFIESKVVEGVKKDYESYMTNIKEKNIFGTVTKKKSGIFESEFEVSKAVENLDESQRLGSKSVNKKQMKGLEKKLNNCIQKEDYDAMMAEIKTIKTFSFMNAAVFLTLIMVFLIVLFFLILAIKELNFKLDSFNSRLPVITHYIKNETNLVKEEF